MARKTQVDEVALKILGYVGEGVFPAKISSAIGLRLTAIVRRLYRYEKEGYVIRKNKVWYLTEKGQQISSRLVPITATNTATLRRHNIRVKVPLREPLENPQVYLGSRGIVYKAMGLRNVNAASFTLERHIVELMPRSAIVCLPEVVVPVKTPIVELASLTYDKLDVILNNVEVRLGLRFKRPNKDFWLAKLVSNEIAFTNHPIAESMRGVGKGVWVIEYDEDDQKPRLIVDYSNGVPELEAVHSKHSVEDAALIQRRVGGFLEEVKGGEFDKWRAGIQEVLSEYGEYLKAHVGFVQKADKVLGDIIEERTRQSKIIGNEPSPSKSTLEMSSKELKEYWARRRNNGL